MLCGIRTLKKAFSWAWLPLCLLFGLVWCSSPAEAAEITLNASPVETSTAQVSVDGSNFAYEQTINQSGWFDKPFVCLRANGLTFFNTGDLVEFQFLIQTWGDNVAKLNTRLSNYDNVSGFSAISSQVSQFSSSSGQVSIIYQATRDLTLPNNTSFCIRNSDNSSNNLSAFNNVVVSGGKATHYRLDSASAGATSSDISNQTQDLIDYQDNQRSEDTSEVQGNADDATNTINSWNTGLLGAFSSLFGGLSSWFNTLLGWASPDASVGCSFDFSFLGGSSSLNLCSGVPSDILSIIHNISAVFAFFVIIMILRSIFEDIMALINNGGVS